MTATPLCICGECGRGAVATISQRYIDGHEVIFADPASDLAGVVSQTEEVAADLRKECHRTSKLGHRGTGQNRPPR